MRIAQVGSKGYNFNGGVENVVRQISLVLCRRNNLVTIFGRKKYSRSTVSDVSNLNLRNTFSIETKHLGQISATFTSLIFCCFNKNVKIIHLHSFVNIIFSWIPKLFGKKVVLTIHGFEWRINKWSHLDKKILKSLLFLLKIIPDSVTSVSFYDAEFLTRLLKMKVEYIPNGITSSDLQKISIITPGISLAPFEYILWVGRFTYQKGLEYLIDAYNQIKTDKKLVLIGYQFHTDNYYNMISKKCENNQNIIFTGPQFGLNLAAFYSNAYLFVHPSECESNSLVTLEALSFNNCLLASDIPGIKNIAKEHAYYFQSRNSVDLKEKLEFLLTNPDEVQKMRTASREFVETSYNWDKIVIQYENIYMNLLKN